VRTYFRDVNDHLVRVHEQVESYRELLTSVLEANLTQVSVRQNDDMRKISAWVAIAAVPTMLAGIYGMNFEHMPELRYRLGYPAVLLVMVLACFALYRNFKRVGWL
jgi:magnesium transporter